MASSADPSFGVPVVPPWKVQAASDVAAEKVVFALVLLQSRVL
ncbi:hypothetical protein [Arthrobacter sp. N199823]|nr:hypothetical protein [Arthrobacter sp. N199823]